MNSRLSKKTMCIGCAVEPTLTKPVGYGAPRYMYQGAAYITPRPIFSTVNQPAYTPRDSEGFKPPHVEIVNPVSSPVNTQYTTSPGGLDRKYVGTNWMSGTPLGKIKKMGMFFKKKK